MDITIKEMAERLREYDEYRIVYHIRPDGDCIGSAFALCLALQSIGKKCDVVGQDSIPQVHRYLTDEVKMDDLNDSIYIVVDAAAPYRIGSYIDNHFTFCIDHHDNTFFDVDYRYVEQDCGACSEIIFKLIKAMDIPVTELIASLLYTAIVTDTNCFRTSDTSIQTFETAIELMKAGADIYMISRLNTLTKSKGRLQIEDVLRSSFHFTCDEQILTGIIRQSDLKKAGVLDSDLEGINSLLEQVEGVRIAVTIRELTNGRMRCSMRTNGDISANEICKLHGGGGHFHAAGCDIEADAETARNIIEETCKKFICK